MRVQLKKKILSGLYGIGRFRPEAAAQIHVRGAARHYCRPERSLETLPIIVVTIFYISGRDLYDRALEMAFLHLPTAAPVAADDAYRHLINTGL